MLCGFLARRWRCGAGGDSVITTNPESTVPSAARGGGEAGLGPAGADVGQGSAVSTEVLAGQLSLGELRRFPGLVQAGLLALDLARVTREEALALERDAQLRVGFDERPRDAMANRACLAGRAAAVDPDAQVIAALGAGEPERSHHGRAVRGAREVLLERAAVDPRRPVSGAEDHTGDGS